MTEPVEKISVLRWVTMTALAALFVSDYAFDAWAKPVPNWAYVTLAALAVGIDARQLRELILTFLRGWVSQKTKDGK